MAGVVFNATLMIIINVNIHLYFKWIGLQKNKTCRSRFSFLKIHMALTTWQWMWRGCGNHCRCHNKPDHCFMGNKSAPAVNILALAVTLFGAFCYLKTAPCVRRMTTFWTIHHIQIPTFAIRIIAMIHKISILRTIYSISRSSIFTSSSILVVKPLSGLTVCVRVVMVHSASSIGCLKPLTFTGISV